MTSAPRKRLLLAADDAALAALVASAAAPLGADLESSPTGRDTLEALARRPAAAILDLPLADAGAAELLAACARHGVPAVVVSGVYRGARAEQALRAHGAREFFEKPFALEALTAAVAGIIGRPAPPLADAADEVTGAAPIRQELAGGAAPAFPGLDHAPRASAAAAVLDGLSAPLPRPRAGRADAARAPSPGAERVQARGQAIVPRLLTALHLGQATGALTLSRGSVRKLVVVERGVPVYAASNLAQERFGAVCVRRGVVAADRLEALRRAAPEVATGDLLVEHGILTAARRAELIAAQVRAIAWSTFEWRDHEHVFQLGRPPARRVPLAIPMGDLVLEGIRRTATLPRLREELAGEVHLAPSPDPAFELYALRLRPEEARLLPIADGTKSVDDLVRLSELPERDTLAFLHGCRVMRVLDDVERVLASTRRIGFM